MFLAYDALIIVVIIIIIYYYKSAYTQHAEITCHNVPQSQTKH